jgi:WhiB family redox-sensing transcriptional regulator
MTYLTHDQVDSEWMNDAACAGENLDLFFPDDRRDGHNAKAVRAAKAICATCPVQTECLDYALTTGIKFGVWGGTSERDRRPLRRQLRQTWAAQTGSQTQ